VFLKKLGNPRRRGLALGAVGPCEASFRAELASTFLCNEKVPVYAPRAIGRAD
jgi:hypothetical protein